MVGKPNKGQLPLPFLNLEISFVASGALSKSSFWWATHLIGHDFGKVLVGCRGLVADVLVGVAHNASHGLLEILLCDAGEGFGAGHAPASTVGTGAPALAVALAPDYEGAGAHAARDDAQLPSICAGGTCRGAKPRGQQAWDASWQDKRCRAASHQAVALLSSDPCIP